MKLYEIYNEIITEKLNMISYDDALGRNLFGPVYHGSTPENLKNIQDKGFEIFVGGNRSGNVRHGYSEEGYGLTGTPPPIHHLGYGIYFTTVKSIAKNFNQGTTKGLKEYYLDVPRVETINFGSPKTMMKWWIQNGYDPELAEKDRVKATQILTDNLKSKYDAVYFKGQGMYRLLDGNQIVVFDTNRIYQVDKSLSVGKSIGSKIILSKDVLGKRWDRNIDTGEETSTPYILVPKGTIGIIKNKREAKSMRDYWASSGNKVPHWTNDSEYVYTITFKKGGTQSNILDDMIEPI